jgi:hypothetical protein
MVRLPQNLTLPVEAVELLLLALQEHLFHPSEKVGTVQHLLFLDRP